MEKVKTALDRAFIPVPELVFPSKGHIGSLDVDLALDARKLEPKAYESIRKKLADAGY